jgi:hypothetical protein
MIPHPDQIIQHVIRPPWLGRGHTTCGGNLSHLTFTCQISNTSQMKIQIRKESFTDSDGELKQFQYACVVDEHGNTLPSAQTALNRILTMDPHALQQLVEKELSELLGLTPNT